LYRFHAKRIYSKHRNSYRVSMPFNNKFYTSSRQYKHAYLNKLEFAYATNNRFFNKYRRNRVKDFFLKKDHLKIFYLYQKKIYYNFCLAQNEVVKNLKVFAIKKLAKCKIKVNDYAAKKVDGRFHLATLKKEMIFFYRLVKNSILLNFSSSEFDYFLNFFLLNLLNISAVLKKPKKLFKFQFKNLQRHTFLGSKVLSSKLSFFLYAK